jgi:hypothetical protein
LYAREEPSLLSGLRELKYQNDCFRQLTKDSRTLLNTPRVIHLQNAFLVDGMFVYVLVLKNVYKTNFDEFLYSPLASQFLRKIDGIPLAKSNTSSFWPLWGLIKGEITPFLIGVFHGMSKPDDIDEYFTPFIRKWISSWQTVAST